MSNEIKKKHPFSKFGPAPYRYVGNVTITIGERGTQVSNPELSRKAKSGTCANCGHGILYNYVIQCGDGSLHSVGSDCAHKLYGDYNVRSEILTQIEKQALINKRKIAKEQRQEKRRKATSELLPQALELFEQKKDILSKLPHPSEYFSKQGKTALDYFIFIMPKSGSSPEAVKKFINSLKAKGE